MGQTTITIPQATKDKIMDACEYYFAQFGVKVNFYNAIDMAVDLLREKWVKQAELLGGKKP